MSIPNSSSSPLGYMGLDPYVNPPVITAMRAPTVNDLYNAGTQWEDRSVSPPVLYITVGAGIWETGGNAQATTTIAGITRYATTA